MKISAFTLVIPHGYSLVCNHLPCTKTTCLQNVLIIDSQGDMSGEYGSARQAGLCAVVVFRDTAIVRHVPRKISATCFVSISGSRQFSADLPRGEVLGYLASSFIM